VCAVPDEVRGDEVAACIIPKDPLPAGDAQRQAAEDVVKFCLSRLAYYKAPGYVAFVNDVPLTATQKIQRGSLKAFAAEAIRGTSGFDTRNLKRRQLTDRQ
jgi:acyl-coenzyme A synthetase/AMP-(fatty) acid ligase